ncbi:MAG TPA: hypothetical protein VNJ08_08110 [Bacteriovoracaceae bacterium]|nr:hypothetical protein [Bacteriovoracaceae bacterium]
MATSRKIKKKPALIKKSKRSFKESLKELLGKGLLETKSETTMTLFLLKGALNSNMLNS